MASGGTRVGRPEAEIWDNAVEQGRAAKAYADFVCANLPAGIRTMRGERGGMAMCDLARRTGLDRQTVGPVNNGDTMPTPHTTARIAFVLCAGHGFHERSPHPRGHRGRAYEDQ